jgi:hypothetical protein
MAQFIDYEEFETGTGARSYYLRGHFIARRQNKLIRHEFIQGATLPRCGSVVGPRVGKSSSLLSSNYLPATLIS